LTVFSSVRIPYSFPTRRSSDLRLYDSFSAKYGLINDRANRLAFADDSSYYLLCALEVIDEDGKLERKADISYRDEMGSLCCLFCCHFIFPKLLNVKLSVKLCRIFITLLLN